MKEASMISSNSKQLHSKPWFPEINLMRGMLILLVVTGHVVTQAVCVSPTLAMIFHILGDTIYSFHMPAFFMISGFLAYRFILPENNVSKRTFTYQRWLRLMVPYFTLGCIYLPFKIGLPFISRNIYQLSDIWKIFIGNNPDGALWYLYALFCIFVLTEFLIKEKTLSQAIIICLILNIISSFIIWPYAIIPQILENLCFFLLGIYFRLHYSEILSIFRKKFIGILLLVIFILCNFGLQFYHIKPMSLLTSISGSALIFIFAMQINQRTAKKESPDSSMSGDTDTNKLLHLIGRYGMDIYILSEPIKVIFRYLFIRLSVPTLLASILLIIISVAGSILLSKYLIRRIKFLRILLLGMK